MKSKKTILISAGEISGDMHGAHLVREIKKKDPTIRFIGMGHHMMQDAGVEIYADVVSASTIGFIEPLRHLPKIIATYFRMKALLKKECPKALIVIDYQGYHMLLIKAAKKLGIPVIYYIAPQEWQWGTEAGGKQVIMYTDLILSIFKEENKFYTRLGGHSVYIGHPILDIAQSKISKPAFYAREAIPNTKRILSIFPGSRPQELTHTLPVLLQAAKQLCTQNQDLHLMISIASPALAVTIKASVDAQGLPHQVQYYTDNNYELIAHTTLSLCTSGTITLEHAALGTPFIANYRFGKLSFWLAKKILAKKLAKIPFIALPNLIANKKIAPEFLQDSCTPQAIAETANTLLNDPITYQIIKNNLLTVQKTLGPPGVITRAAMCILSLPALADTDRSGKSE